jgi:galactokinase/mevalonate kinase-like predicted kinase
VSVGELSTVFRNPRDYLLKRDRFDVVRAVMQYFGRTDLKLSINVTTTVPVQGGLSGSTAILSSIVAGLLRMWGRELSRYYLAETVRIIELNYLKIHCGYKDHYMTVFGGVNFMDFREKENYRRLGDEIYASVEPLAPHATQLPFLLAHSGIKHVSGAVHLPIRERWLDGEKLVVEGYERISALARRGKRALIERDWQTLADLMSENHRIQHEISHVGERNLSMMSAALENGALAAKLAGAGGGGTIIVLTHDPDRQIPALKEAGAARFLTLSPSPGVTVETAEA